MLWRYRLPCWRSIRHSSLRICVRSSHSQSPFKPNVPFTPFDTKYSASIIAMAKQYKIFNERHRKRQKLNSTQSRDSEGTTEEVLTFEVAEILSRSRQDTDEKSKSNETTSETPDKSGERFQEIEVEIEEQSSTGDGLARSHSGDHVYVVPFSVPGDRVLANVSKDTFGRPWSNADFVKLIRPSPMREGITPKCQYFSTCSGCQLQMLSYEDQLAHKKTIVEKAFRNFSGLIPEKVPAVGSTMGSPLQYGYRTKLTPHFDGPPRKRGVAGNFTELPPFGFTRKNFRKVLDIENCPIGTEIVQEGFKTERQKLAKDFNTYRNGATILVRESTERIPNSPSSESTKPTDGDALIAPLSKELTTTATGAPQITLQFPTHKDIKTYTADYNAITTEYVSSFVFNSRAGSFFQNNNSVLPSFISYVRDNCIPTSNTDSSSSPSPPIKYLLDAYCGSGLFAVTLSPLFSSVLGIDIDGKGIVAARENAAANNIPNAGFIEADAGALFADVPFPCDQSLVVIDPPRKGASRDFLEQLCLFGPKRVVYVSCNVHTQARDVGLLVNGFGGKWRYEIESLRGFDFFPQTSHVEGLCFLDRVATEKTE